MTRRALRYIGHSCFQGLIGYAALIAVFEAGYFAQMAIERRRRR